MPQKEVPREARHDANVGMLYRGGRILPPVDELSNRATVAFDLLLMMVASL